MKIRTSTFTERSPQYLMPSATYNADRVDLSSFVPHRKWRRRELVIGRKVFPLGNWKQA